MIGTTCRGPPQCAHELTYGSTAGISQGNVLDGVEARRRGPVARRRVRAQGWVLQPCTTATRGRWCASGEACSHCSGMQKQLKLTWQLERHQSEAQTQERGRWSGCTCPSAFSGCHLRDMTVTWADSRSVGPSALQAVSSMHVPILHAAGCTHANRRPRRVMG